MLVFRLVLLAGLLALTVAGIVTLRGRRRAFYSSGVPRLDDDAVERILSYGQLFVEDDEPLDLREINDEEERFWSETWDEPGTEI
jgi:hypothetical protein